MRKELFVYGAGGTTTKASEFQKPLLFRYLRF
jgi:hypothetical protein